MDTTKLVSLLRACISSKSLKQGKLIHQKIVSLGLQNNTVISKSLVNFYLSCHLYDSAKLVFQTIENPIEISLWNGFMAAYTKNFMFIEALELYERLLRYPYLKPDSYTYPSVLKACGGLGRVKSWLCSKKSLKASKAPNLNKPYRVCDNCFNKVWKAIESDGSSQSLESLKQVESRSSKKNRKLEFNSSRVSPVPNAGKFVVDDTKRKNDSLCQEVMNLRAQVETLTRKALLQEIELERITKQLKEEIAIAGEGTKTCKAAKEVSNSLTGQLKGLAERPPVGTEWIEQVEPGVYITLTSLPGGINDIKRIRFSRKRFSEKQAEQWWAENRTRVYERYNVHMNNKSNFGVGSEDLSNGEDAIPSH
ncbi:PH, RCC1 and FYVE domains-containing protein 1-like isoform X1 [Fagus crenata]